MTDNNLKITYKGEDIVDTDISTATTKTLKTSGKYCEGDIVVTAQGGSGSSGDLYTLPTITKNGTYAVPQSQLKEVKFLTTDGIHYIDSEILLNQPAYIDYFNFVLNSTSTSVVVGSTSSSGQNDRTFVLSFAASNIKRSDFTNSNTMSYRQEIGVEYVYREVKSTPSSTSVTLIRNDQNLTTRTMNLYPNMNAYTNTLFIGANNSYSGVASIFSGKFGKLILKAIYGDSTIIDFKPFIDTNGNAWYKLNGVFSPAPQGWTASTDDIVAGGEEYDFIGFNSPITVNVPVESYGIHLNGWVPSGSAGYATTFPDSISELQFNGLVNASTQYLFAYRWYSAKNVPSINMVDYKGGTNSYAWYYSFYNATFRPDSYVKMPIMYNAPSSYMFNYMFYGCTNIEYAEIGRPDTTIPSISGQSACGYMFYNCNLSKGFVWHGYPTISGSSVFANCFGAGSVKYFNEDAPVEFSNITTVSGASALAYAIYYRGCRTGRKWNVLPKLETVNGSSTLSYFFRYGYFGVSSTYPRKEHIITFPKLQNIGNTSGYSTFTYAFANQASTSDFKYCWFPMLKQIGYASTSAYGWFNYAFSGGYSANYCEVCFPELENITSSSTSSTATYSCFNYCNRMSKIWLPKLHNVTGTPNISANGMFRNCTQSGLEIHFGKENETYIKSLTGYASKFGATNATIYFDCINHITVNGVVYNRDGEHYITECAVKETSSSPITHPDDRYSWKDANGNIVYTLECWAPAVGDNVYDANDGVVGTISAVS